MCVCVFGWQTNDPVFDKIWGEVDVNESGYVSFEEFVQFMTKEIVDQDTADQIMNSFKILAGEKVAKLCMHFIFTIVKSQ